MIAFDFDGTLSRCLLPFNGKDVDRFNDPDLLMGQEPLVGGLAYLQACVGSTFVVVTARSRVMAPVIWAWLEANGIANSCKGIAAIGDSEVAVSTKEMAMRKLAVCRELRVMGIIDDNETVINEFDKNGFKAVLVDPLTGKRVKR